MSPPSAQPLVDEPGFEPRPELRGGIVLVPVDIGDHGGVELRPGVNVEEDELRAFASRHGVRRLALFGSALRDDFGLASDIDLLVEFEPGRVPGLLTMASMELELGELIGREVDLRTPGDLSRYFRDRVQSEARPVYAA